MKVYNVIRYRIVAFILSVVLILGFWSYTLFVKNGFNFGIDFKAGLNITVDVPAAGDEESIRKALQEYSPQVQTAGEKEGRFIIRIADNDAVPDFQRTTSGAVSQALKKSFGQMAVVSEEYIGSSFAGSLAAQTIWITLIALGLILLYIWVRFKLNYAVSAIAAVFHDVLFLLGFIGAFQLEFSTATIAAVLTIIGYSLNDTIVIFDRIRENARIVKDKSFGEVVNISISQSLSRTLITSITTLLAVVAILVFATGTIRTFALSLAVGVVVGTYSSLFIASPILLAWHDGRSRKTHESMGKGQTAVSAAPSAPRTRAASQPEPVKQTAEEIALATEKRAKAKAKKKKKKK